MTIKPGWAIGVLVAVAVLFSARTLLVLAVLFHLVVLFGLLALSFRRMSPTTTAEDQLARTIEEQEARLAVLQRTVDDLRRQQQQPTTAPPYRPTRPVRDDDITIPGHRPAY